MSALTREEAQRRVRQALQHIQRAQEEMGRAEALLSNLIPGQRQCSRVSKSYEEIRETWHFVAQLRGSEKLDLDGIAAEALEAKRD